MKETIAYKAFSKFLFDKDYSVYSKNGNKSTVFDYPNRVQKVCKEEGILNLDAFSTHIDLIIEKYSKNGEKAIEGAKSHGSVLKALELFQEFCNSLDIGEQTNE